MKKTILKSKNLNRTELRQINGGVAINPCSILCGPGGGVISTRPGIGDACNPGRSVCCICY